jgi:hypothetical protein
MFSARLPLSNALLLTLEKKRKLVNFSEICLFGCLVKAIICNKPLPYLKCCNKLPVELAPNYKLYCLKA